jgi:hypothetical protein
MVDPDTYLPSETLAWCHQTLQILGYEMPKQGDFFRDHIKWLPGSFLALLHSARDYYKEFPQDLSTVQRPIGGYQWNFAATVLQAWDRAEDMAGHVEGAYRGANDVFD